MSDEDILAAIGSTEASTFNEFCRALKDCPEKGDKAGWRELFGTLEWLEHSGFVEVSRVQGKIDTLILTEAGANRIRKKLDAGRGLFGALNG